jgi:hypothetical protein
LQDCKILPDFRCQHYSNKTEFQSDIWLVNYCYLLEIFYRINMLASAQKYQMFWLWSRRQILTFLFSVLNSNLGQCLFCCQSSLYLYQILANGGLIESFNLNKQTVKIQLCIYCQLLARKKVLCFMIDPAIEIRPDLSISYF